MLPAITEQLSIDDEEEDGSSLLSGKSKQRTRRRRHTPAAFAPSSSNTVLGLSSSDFDQQARQDRYEAERTKRLALRSAAQAAEEFAADFDANSSLAKRSRRLAEMKITDLTIEELVGKGSFSRVYRARLKNDMITPPCSPPRASRNSRKSASSPLRCVLTPLRCSWEDDVNTSQDVLLESDFDGWNMKDVSHASPKKSKGKEMGIFALKHLDLSMLKDPTMFREGAIDLVSEVKLLACLNHPNIIQIFGVTEGSIANSFQTGGGYFVLMEHLKDTLDDRIDHWIDKETSLKNRLDQAALGLAEGLDYLHSRSVVFRDLSPQNVGFSVDGHVKLVDFGLAKEIRNDGAKLTAHTGSLRYMAPEVALGKAYGLTADQYSYAILLWEICTLQKPYDGMSKRRHRDEVVMREKRPSLSRIRTESLKRLLRKCWQARASKRPMFAEIVDELRRERAGNSPRLSPKGKMVKRFLKGGGRPLSKLEDRTNRLTREEKQQSRYIEI
mmetsp:Transcript_13044/g.19234  ORF Transcript_13044/g.19234 Transcript_13044/m.19234 type:complete len:499 (-) Transcript_13044:217-1713(-)